MVEDFGERLAVCKGAIEKQISLDIEALLARVETEFGDSDPLAVTEAFASILQRGGKRVRGVLTMVGYELCGGTDTAMIVRAASVMEFIHAYLLMMDDIQDRSLTRRGGPTAHVMLGEYAAAKEYSGETSHIGMSLTLNAYGIGLHEAMRLLANIQTDPVRLLEATATIHENIGLTAHGQTVDIVNEIKQNTTLSDAEIALCYKTAYYTFLNPLLSGAILAGVTEQQRQLIRDFSLAAGTVFQVTDDIIGVFGSEAETGKNPADDIKEGKRNILTLKALELAEPAAATKLRECLGNEQLTEADFAATLQIITASGALEFARQYIEEAKTRAVESLSRSETIGCNQAASDFLADMVRYIASRTV